VGIGAQIAVQETRTLACLRFFDVMLTMCPLYMSVPSLHEPAKNDKSVSVGRCLQ